MQHIPQAQQDEVLEIVEIIKEIVDPEMIILFGSYARGKFVFDKYRDKYGTVQEYVSDIDILVITKDITKDEYDIDIKIKARTEHLKPAVSLQFSEIDYINEGLEFGQYFYSDIIKEGILLFDKGTVTLSSKRELTPQEEKAKAQHYYDIWFKGGTENIIDAKSIFNRGNYKKAAFELHQAAEKFYYTVLLVFTGYKAKIHNLYKLRKQAASYSEELFQFYPLEKNKEEWVLFDLLKRGYIEARYEEEYEITKQQLEALIERIEKMEVIVDRICKEKIDSLA